MRAIFIILFVLLFEMSSSFAGVCDGVGCPKGQFCTSDGTCQIIPAEVIEDMTRDGDFDQEDAETAASAYCKGKPICKDVPFREIGDIMEDGIGAEDAGTASREIEEVCKGNKCENIPVSEVAAIARDGKIGYDDAGVVAGEIEEQCKGKKCENIPIGAISGIAGDLIRDGVTPEVAVGAASTAANTYCEGKTTCDNIPIGAISGALSGVLEDGFDVRDAGTAVGVATAAYCKAKPQECEDMPVGVLGDAVATILADGISAEDAGTAAGVALAAACEQYPEQCENYSGEELGAAVLGALQDGKLSAADAGTLAGAAYGAYCRDNGCGGDTNLANVIGGTAAAVFADDEVSATEAVQGASAVVAACQASGTCSNSTFGQLASQVTNSITSTQQALLAAEGQACDYLQLGIGALDGFYQEVLSFGSGEEETTIVEEAPELYQIPCYLPGTGEIYGIQPPDYLRCLGCPSQDTDADAFSGTVSDSDEDDKKSSLNTLFTLKSTYVLPQFVLRSRDHRASLDNIADDFDDYEKDWEQDFWNDMAGIMDGLQRLQQLQEAAGAASGGGGGGGGGGMGMPTDPFSAAAQNIFSQLTGSDSGGTSIGDFDVESILGPILNFVYYEDAVEKGVGGWRRSYSVTDVRYDSTRSSFAAPAIQGSLTLGVENLSRELSAFGCDQIDFPKYEGRDDNLNILGRFSQCVDTYIAGDYDRPDPIPGYVDFNYLDTIYDPNTFAAKTPAELENMGIPEGVKYEDMKAFFPYKTAIASLTRNIYDSEGEVKKPWRYNFILPNAPRRIIDDIVGDRNNNGQLDQGDYIAMVNLLSDEQKADVSDRYTVDEGLEQEQQESAEAIQQCQDQKVQDDQNCASGNFSRDTLCGPERPFCDQCDTLYTDPPDISGCLANCNNCDYCGGLNSVNQQCCENKATDDLNSCVSSNTSRDYNAVSLSAAQCEEKRRQGHNVMDLPSCRQHCRRSYVNPHETDEPQGVTCVVPDDDDDTEIRDSEKEFGYEKYCHAIEEGPYALKREIKAPNPYNYLPFERIYNPRQSPWFPRNTVVGRINTTMSDDNPQGLYLGTTTCSFWGLKMFESGEDYKYDIDSPQGCFPCDWWDDEADYFTNCSIAPLMAGPPSWWHTKYANCGEVSKCSGGGDNNEGSESSSDDEWKRSVDILKSRKTEYLYCLNLYVLAECMMRDCLDLQNAYAIAVEMIIGAVIYIGLSILYPASEGYCCPIIEDDVTIHDAEGKHVNMIEVRHRIPAWRDESPSARPDLEELNIQSPSSILRRSEADDDDFVEMPGLNYDDDFEGKRYHPEETRFWWPWSFQMDLLGLMCMEPDLPVSTMPAQPYWTWYDTGDISPHEDGSKNDAISPGLPGANCGYGGWEELKLYQARCIKYFGLNCLCKYEQTFKEGSAESYVLKMLGGAYDDYDQNGNPIIRFWPIPWQGYLSTPTSYPSLPNLKNLKSFPIGRITGLFDEKEGLENALPGDIVVWDEDIGEHPESSAESNRFLMLPHTSYVVESYNEAYFASQNKDPDNPSEHHVVVREYNYGKLPDSCGNTTNWGRETERTLFKKIYPDEQNISSKAFPTCLDPEHKLCEEPYWDKVKVYSMNDYGRLISTECDYLVKLENGTPVGILTNDIKGTRALAKEYEKGLEAFEGSVISVDFEEVLRTSTYYYEYKEAIARHIRNGCFPPSEWNKRIRKNMPHIASLALNMDFLPAAEELKEEHYIGGSGAGAAGPGSDIGPGHSVYIPGGDDALNIEEIPDYVYLRNANPDYNIDPSDYPRGQDDDNYPEIEPVPNPDPNSDEICFDMPDIKVDGNPELVVSTMQNNSTADTNNDIPAQFRAFLSENDPNTKAQKLQDMLDSLRGEVTADTENLLTLMTYLNNDDTCNSDINSLLPYKDDVVARNANLTNYIDNLNAALTSAIYDPSIDESSVINDTNTIDGITYSLLDYSSFQLSYLAGLENITTQLRNCANIQGAGNASNVNNLNNIQENLNVISGYINQSGNPRDYQTLYDGFFDFAPPSTGVSLWGSIEDGSQNVNEISENIEDDVREASRGPRVEGEGTVCFDPATGGIGITLGATFNPMIMGGSQPDGGQVNNGDECTPQTVLSEDEPLSVQCSEPPDSKQDPPACWRNPSAPTCDINGSVDLLGGADTRDIGYSRDYVAQHIQLHTDFNGAYAPQYISDLQNTFPNEWRCDPDLKDMIESRMIYQKASGVSGTISDDIQENKTVAVVVSDRYPLGHSAIVVDYNEANSCVILEGQNWLDYPEQEFRPTYDAPACVGSQCTYNTNCYQSAFSFNRPERSNCIPLSEISYMWNPVCDATHPCN